MGDDELNFTQEEARCWADDPRNQARAGRTFARPLLISLLIALTLLILTYLATFPTAQDPQLVRPTVGTLLLVP